MTHFVDKLFDRTMPGLVKTMDLTWKRNEALVSNIANAETPQYRATDVNFAGELERAFNMNNETVKMTNTMHMDISSQAGSSHLVEDFSGVTKPDGNNVDLDIQMGKLNQNSGKYSTASSLVRKKLQILRQAIRFAMR